MGLGTTSRGGRGYLPAEVRGWTTVQERIYIASLSESEQLPPRLTAPKRAALTKMSESVRRAWVFSQGFNTRCY